MGMFGTRGENSNYDINWILDEKEGETRKGIVFKD